MGSIAYVCQTLPVIVIKVCKLSESCWQKVHSIIKTEKIISNTVKELENYESSSSQMNVAVNSMHKLRLKENIMNSKSEISANQIKQTDTIRN